MTLSYRYAYWNLEQFEQEYWYGKDIKPTTSPIGVELGAKTARREAGKYDNHFPGSNPSVIKSTNYIGVQKTLDYFHQLPK